MDLLFFDLETTGLDPEKDSILEVAALPFKLTDKFWDDYEPESWVIGFNGEIESEYVREMHTETGLLAECRESTTTLADRDWETCQSI